MTHSDGGSDGNIFAVVEQGKNYHVNIYVKIIPGKYLG
jgi:hypothetical protein